MDPELLDQLKIEGRILSVQQAARLEATPVYQFYMSGRFERGSFILPNSLRFTIEKIAALLQSEFSPSSLEADVGYKTGYFSTRELLDRWLDDFDPNRLLPILGGVNEFRIGSDTLTQEELAEVSGLLSQAFVDQEASKSHLQVTANLANFTSYPLSNLNLINKIDITRVYSSELYNNSLKIINPNIINNSKSGVERIMPKIKNKF